MQEKKYTREDIEKLKTKDKSELTGEERSLANLKPIKPGERRNPNGRPKGATNWSVHFKRLMGDEKFLSTIISQLPKKWDNIVDKYPADVIAAGLIATATQQVARAISEGKPVDEQTLKIIDRISKIGYGEMKNVNLDAEEGGLFDKFQINFVTVPDRKKESEG